MLTLRSIQSKIALWTGLCLLLAASVIIGYAAVSLNRTARAATEKEAVGLGQSQAGAIKQRVEVALATARTLAQVLSGLAHSEVQLTRDEVNTMLYQVLVDNPDFYGVYTMWEPNAFDQLDERYVNTPLYDHTGRFMPFWFRQDDGSISVQPLQEYEAEGPTSEWYFCPMRTGMECIIDPMLYPVQDEEVLMASLTVPILARGRFYGIVGVDIHLDFLQNLADAADIYGGEGRLSLISNNGTLAGVSGHPELVGASMSELYSDHAGQLPRLQQGELIVEDQGQELQAFVPITLGKTQTPWSVGITVPARVITAEARRLTLQMIAIGGVLILVSLGLLWLVSAQIARPIRTITGAAVAVAEGDLNRTVSVPGSDEVSVLSAAFNQMVERLREMLSGEQQQRAILESTVARYAEHMEQVGRGALSARLELAPQENGADPLVTLGHRLNATTESLRGIILGIREAASALSAASAEILAATTQQASGASEQSAAISQTTTTVDEVKTIAEQVSHRAQEVTAGSQRTVEVSQSGQQAVQATIESMGQIKERVEGIAENILTLSEQTQQIGEIITTVNDIAAQSNILALNASVEAARAGEHGKGFAVVAVEVRNLAEQSRAATRQVREILGEIQKATNTTVMATEEGTKQVDVGVQTAAQARVAIDQLSRVIAESAQAATQMVAGGRQQVSGVEQVALAMRNINQATVQSLASTRQAERSAQDLNELARELMEMVAEYGR
jgi:methyl-accepting chemotaxis protein